MSIESGLVKLEEKHGTFLFKFETRHELYNICLKIVNARHKSGYWYYDEHPRQMPVFEEVPGTTLVTLPKSLYEIYLKQLKDHKNKLAEYKDELAEYELLQLALENPRKAYEFLDYRSNFEYEGFKVVQLDNIDKYRG